MLEKCLRALLTFNATSLLLVVYQIKEPFLFPSLQGIYRFMLLGVVLGIPVLLTKLSITLAGRLSKDSYKSGDIVSIEHANNAFLPSYLGYFFVALSVPDGVTLGFVYGILYVFTFASQALYFNPIFLFFGYKFYNITTRKGTVIFLISKCDFRTPADVEIPSACRINGYTLLEEA